MNKGHINRAVIAALSLAAISTGAYAYPGSDSMGKNGNCQGHDKGHAQAMHKRGDMFQLPAAVIEQLNLTSAQKVALFDAQTATAAMRQGMRESMRQARKARQEAMSTDEFNPRTLFEQQDERMAQMQAARKSIQQQWLGFWDSLDQTQQATIAQYMQSRMGGGKGQHGAMKHSGKQGS